MARRSKKARRRKENSLLAPESLECRRLMTCDNLFEGKTPGHDIKIKAVGNVAFNSGICFVGDGAQLQLEAVGQTGTPATSHSTKIEFQLSSDTNAFATSKETVETNPDEFSIPAFAGAQKLKFDVLFNDVSKFSGTFKVPLKHGATGGNDKVAPEIHSVSLGNTTSDGDSTLPVSILSSPEFTVHFTEQLYPGDDDNTVSFAIVTSETVIPLKRSSNASSNLDDVHGEPTNPGPLVDKDSTFKLVPVDSDDFSEGKTYVNASLRITDSEGNSQDSEPFSFALRPAPASPTLHAPQTPVYNDVYHIGSRVEEVDRRAILHVGAPIPVGSNVTVEGMDSTVTAQRFLISMEIKDKDGKAISLPSTVKLGTKFAGATVIEVEDSNASAVLVMDRLLAPGTAGKLAGLDATVTGTTIEVTLADTYAGGASTIGYVDEGGATATTSMEVQYTDKAVLRLNRGIPDATSVVLTDPDQLDSTQNSPVQTNVWQSLNKIVLDTRLPSTFPIGSSIGGAQVKGQFEEDGKTALLLDRLLPAGTSVNVAGVSATVESAVSEVLVTKKLNNVKVNDTIAWMQNWQIAFDKTTQTIWFNSELGNLFAQFDPATEKLTTYDLATLLPNSNPHGIFFDFNSHLTPRVWIAHRVAGGNRAAFGGQGITAAKLSYFDVETRELVTYDIAELLNEQGSELELLDSQGNPVAADYKDFHAAFVDTAGSVWVSADHDNTLLQFDIPRDSPGGSSGSLIVHEIPPVLRRGVNGVFAPHGIEVVVDEVTGEQYVWLISEGGLGRVALLQPGRVLPLEGVVAATSTLEIEYDARLFQARSAYIGRTVRIGEQETTITDLRRELVSVTTDAGTAVQQYVLQLDLDREVSSGGQTLKQISIDDQWTTWEVPDEAKAANTRGTFLKVDDGETPGKPSDDRVLAVFPVARSVPSFPDASHHHGETSNTPSPQEINDLADFPDVQLITSAKGGKLVLNAVIENAQVASEKGLDHLHVHVKTPTGWTKLTNLDLNTLAPGTDGSRRDGVQEYSVAELGDSFAPDKPSQRLTFAITLRDDQHGLFEFENQPIGVTLEVQAKSKDGQLKSAVVSYKNPTGIALNVTGVAYLLDPKIDSNGNMAAEADFKAWQLPGHQGTVPEHAGINHPVFSRTGSLIYADRLGAVGRMDMDQLDPTENLPATVTRITGAAPISAAGLGLIPTAQKSIPASDINTEPALRLPALSATQDSQRQKEGLDSYTLAGQATAIKGQAKGQGGFRAAINASNVMYSSLSQNDMLATTIFAETDRRQMAVVQSPEDGRSPRATVEGRIAFQVLRDGSIAVTGRANGQLLDTQLNLNRLLAATGEEHLVEGDVGAVTKADGTVVVYGKNKSGGAVIFTMRAGMWGSVEEVEQAELNLNERMFSPDAWSVNSTATLKSAERILIGNPIAYTVGNDAFAVVTTSDGRMLRIAETGVTLDLSAAIPGADSAQLKTYADPAVVQSEQYVYVYASNQRGGLVEVRYDKATDAVSGRTVHQPSDRDLMVFQSINAAEELGAGGERIIYATDGHSRLVQVVVGETSSQARNLTSEIIAADRAWGYFDFQREFGARTYSDLTVLESNGRHFVYGTNGGDLILFIGGPEADSSDGQDLSAWNWSASNLTQDTLSIYGDPEGPNHTRNVRGEQVSGLPRRPGNSSFGSPAGYVTNGSDRHIFQITAEGEVVEYYINFNEELTTNDYPRFHTQNINLRTKLSPTDLSLAGHLVTKSDATVTIEGTPGDDQIQLQLGAFTHTLEVNGHRHTYSAAEVTQFKLDGGAGVDSVQVVGAKWDDTGWINGDEASLESTEYQVETRAFETTTLLGGEGNDYAKLYGSDADDRLSALPFDSTLTTPEHTLRAAEFERVDSYGRGGRDYASIFGTMEDDLYFARDTYALMKGGGNTTYTKGFERVDAFGRGGNDRAKLYDSPGYDQFIALPLYAYLQNPSRTSYTKGFERVDAHSLLGGDDRAFFYDDASSGATDYFYSREDYAFMHDSGGYLNYANGFSGVRAFSRSGADRATFHDVSAQETAKGAGDLAEVVGLRDAAAKGFAEVILNAKDDEEPLFLVDSNAIDYVLRRTGRWTE